MIQEKRYPPFYSKLMNTTHNLCHCRIRIIHIICSYIRGQNLSKTQVGGSAMLLELVYKLYKQAKFE